MSPEEYQSMDWGYADDCGGEPDKNGKRKIIKGFDKDKKGDEIFLIGESVEEDQKKTENGFSVWKGSKMKAKSGC
ncbi:MAG: hypothetical protein M1514_03590 [Patescibacteria group bacterium]|nr:hypothetical protein [Patescibacteria group bacterium]